MKQFPNLILGLSVAALLLLASLQGSKVNHLQNSDRFYRWIISSSNQVRVFGDPGQAPPGEDPAKYVDKELFAKLVELTNSALPDIEVGENDLDPQGKPFDKVVRYTFADISESADAAAANEVEEGSDAIEALGAGQQEIYTDEQRARDATLWAFAQSSDASELRTDLIDAYRDGRVAGFGTQLGVAGMYEEKGTNISLANMFFGFRKMAANLVWLEVDRFWHKGMMHRMMPLMKSCVTLDPSFVDAYLLGSWHMAYNATAQMDDTPWELRVFDPVHEAWVGRESTSKERFYFFGVDFLRDGIRKNPRNYKLYFDLGYSIYEEKLNDHVNAIKYLDQATRLDHDSWVRRQLYRIQGVDERYEESMAGWESYRKGWPQNVTAPRFIKLMQGEILDRDTTYAGIASRFARDMAERLQTRGEDASTWLAKSDEKRKLEIELSEKAKAHWHTLIIPGATGPDQDTYVEARLLKIEAAELRAQERFEEAIAALEQGRWLSNEFWNHATDLIIQYKKDGDLPLSVTELRYIDRNEDQLQYVRHMPKSLGGKQYRFADGTWTRTDYAGESYTDVKADSDEAIKLQYEHPEVYRLTLNLDGNIILKAGDSWYRFVGAEPAKPSKLNPYIPA